MEIGVQKVGVKSIRDVWSEPGPLWSYNNTYTGMKNMFLRKNE